LEILINMVEVSNPDLVKVVSLLSNLLSSDNTLLIQRMLSYHLLDRFYVILLLQDYSEKGKILWGLTNVACESQSIVH
jgi:hypothetical protein